jgi:hypothetical protein
MLNRTLSLVSLAVALMQGSAAFAQTCQDITVPAYFYPVQPTSPWNTAVSDAPLPRGRVRTLILNPASGPGTAINPDYVTAVSTVKAAGRSFLVLGYVHTSYGARPLADVEAEVSQYVSWYDVDGIFVDEVASSASLIAPYYQPLVTYIMSLIPGGDVTLNPGVYPDEQYMAISVPSHTVLSVVTFEGTYATYVQASIPAWAFNYPDYRFVHLIYDTTSSQLGNALSLSSSRNVGQIYVTDLTLPNPWANLASYWSQLVTTTESGCN